jgi:type II secretory ATPase GspE/PulE/Tfp pilus assembly ATPase PilB-like protein
VLATLHTADAVGAVTRLADVGVEPFKLAAALRGVVAQRLVRRLCAACRRPVAPGWREPRLVGRPPDGEPCWAPPEPGPGPGPGPGPHGAGGDATGGTPGGAGGDATGGTPGGASGDATGGPCGACDGSGYRGRVPALEVLLADAAFARLVTDGAAPGALRRAARAGGTASIWASAVGHLRAGTTSAAELLRVLDAPGAGEDAPDGRPGAA